MGMTGDQWYTLLDDTLLLILVLGLCSLYWWHKRRMTQIKADERMTALRARRDVDVANCKACRTDCLLAHDGPPDFDG